MTVQSWGPEDFRITPSPPTPDIIDPWATVTLRDVLDSIVTRKREEIARRGMLLTRP